MSRAIFRAYAAKQDDPDSGIIEACLVLPATPYELLDALERLRLDENSSALFRINEFCSFRCLSPFLGGSNDLCELNALAQKLAELDARQAIAFEGLLEMELRGKENPLKLPNLIDLAYSADHCHVVDEALNDSQLGYFLAKNDFLPELADLPDAVFDLLDFERIGREHRRTMGGVLVERTEEHPGGYVERHDPLAEIYKTLDLSPKTPDYTILLSTIHGDRPVRLKLPASPEDLSMVPDHPGAVWECVDCRVPALAEIISGSGDLRAVNVLAQRLAEMEPKALTAYKALLSVTDCRNIQTAGQLMDTLSQYIFSPQFSSPVELARADLAVILCDPDRELLEPYVNLHRYGETLMRQCGGVMTVYGLIERTDQMPIQTGDWQLRQGIMTMR